jgi:protein-tyrosine phosphatase
LTPPDSRQIDFEGVLGFRDLGGYPAKGGLKVAWRRLYRSGELRRMTNHDMSKLKEEIGLASVIDLRNAREGPEQQQEIGLMNEIGAKYYYVPLNTDRDRSEERALYTKFSHMGEVYLYRIRCEEYGRRLVEALEIIARPGNHPLVFHCVAGKDRSGILAAFILSVLGVADRDIIDDYVLAAPHMKIRLNIWRSDPEIPEDILLLPVYTWEAAPESMAWFLSAFKREHGSARGYLEIHGAETSLFDRLKKALLV